VAARYILAILAIVFFVAGLVRMVRDRGRPRQQSRTWLTIAVAFGAVSAWLWLT
jgi:uncharacterized membrane protein HdeD (DUF308 family)